MTSESYAKCRQCDGRRGDTSCELCGGLGYAKPSANNGDDDEGDPPPEWSGDWVEFLEWRHRLERYGLPGALYAFACDGVLPEVDPQFWKLLDIFDTELARLENDDELEEVKQRRRDRQRAEMQSRLHRKAR